MTNKADITEILRSCWFLPNSPVRNASPQEFAQMVDTYFDTLQDLPLDMLKAATSAYLGSGQFFPTPGNLRERALDIAMLSMGLPTAAEAWGQITRGFGIIQAVRCETGERLRLGVDGKAGNEYWAALAAYSKHVDGCDGCYDDRCNDWHPLVKKTFEAMGGDAAIFTNNISADRARFSDGYREIVKREMLRFSMPAEARGYIEDHKVNALGAGEQMKRLAEGMKK